MSRRNSTNRNAIILGFVVGAIAVSIASFLLYPSATPPPPAASAAPRVSMDAEPAGHPQPPVEMGETTRPASPHSFAEDRESAAGTILLSGTIELDPAITQSPGSAVTVFVIARTGPGKGHPVLAHRFDAEAFPLKFSLTGADSMMAGTKPDHVSLEARIDLDGDALTREPGSPIARVGSVALGSTGVSLTLKPEV